MVSLSLSAVLDRIKNLWRRRQGRSDEKLPTPSTASVRTASPLQNIAPDDPIIDYFLTTPGAVELDKLQLASPALRTLRRANVKLVVPLVSQGELIGLLNLGPRRSEQDYSKDDRGLLNTLAAQASPAVRVAQMVRERQAAALERERLDQELRVARLIQQTLLPKDLPSLSGWQVSQYYMPARAVGGDFYDFLYLEDGRLGIVIGDVTDKGIPAALVMATTRSILRSVALRESSPGNVLEQTNELLYHDIPPRMFVTCLYAILDTSSGRLCYANAGHDLPYRWQAGAVSELRATGMPLGLMPGMSYEVKETIVEQGESILFYSDGLVEAHNAEREMFSFSRLSRLLREQTDERSTITMLLHELQTFTGSEWEQEDDVTLVTLQRLERSAAKSQQEQPLLTFPDRTTREIASFSYSSAVGNERLAMQEVGDALQDLGLSPRRLNQIKTAVAEATMNAMEHGNGYRVDLLVQVQIVNSEEALLLRVTDRGGHLVLSVPEEPDIHAKLADLQKPRGWGLYLMKNLADDMRISSDGQLRTLELVFHHKGESYGDTTF